MNLKSFNDKLLSRSGSLRLGEKISLQEQGSAKFGTVDFEHPLLKGIFRNKALSVTSGSGGIETPNIKEYYKSILSESGKGIILLGNMILSSVRSVRAKGKYYSLRFPLSPAAGDFPSKSIFVPLITRAVNYLSGNVSSYEQYYVGFRNIVRASGLSNVKTVLNPSGSLDTLNISFGERGEKYFTLHYNNATVYAGIYKASDSSGNEFSFALNPDPIESDLRVATEKEAREHFSEKGYQGVFYFAWDDAKSSYASSKQGSQLWKYFLILALLALAAEKFLSRKLEKGE